MPYVAAFFFFGKPEIYWLLWELNYKSTPFRTHKETVRVCVMEPLR